MLEHALKSLVGDHTARLEGIKIALKWEKEEKLAEAIRQQDDDVLHDAAVALWKEKFPEDHKHSDPSLANAHALAYAKYQEAGTPQPQLVLGRGDGF